jgi:hypothetical protein
MECMGGDRKCVKSPFFEETNLQQTKANHKYFRVIWITWVENL